MLARMLRVVNAIRGVVTFLLLVANLIFWGSLFLVIALFRIPVIWWPAGRRAVVLTLAGIGDMWSIGNKHIILIMLSIEWVRRDDLTLNRNGRYLIVCNHQSWVDIAIVLQQLVHRIPFIRFFMKRQLLWVPILGVACWALDMPFMKRYSPGYLEAHPEKRGQDLETTRRACSGYREIPVAILAFVEGTRFTWQKHEDQNSPYATLLRPRAGAVSYVLASLGGELDALLDVTIAYDCPDMNVWNFVTNKVKKVLVDVRAISIPRHFVSDAITQPGPVRDEFKQWFADIWSRKDAVIRQFHEETRKTG